MADESGVQTFQEATKIFKFRTTVLFLNPHHAQQTISLRPCTWQIDMGHTKVKAVPVG